jgi:Fe-S-cluster containining protein
MNSVPCNGCRICCLGDSIRILPHEDASQWQTEQHFKLPAHRQLAHKLNGECYYLTETGCGIHGSQPEQCRKFDCRILAKRITYTQARKINIPIAVWRKGKELLRATP